MRYSNEFKKKSVGLYRQGRYPKTPDNISSERFHKQVREWVRIEDACGPDALNHKSHPLNNLLKAIKLSRSTYYYEISKPDYDEANNADIVAEIKAIFEKHKYRYGARRVHKELQNKGCSINHKKVQRLMNKYGLMAKRPKEKYHFYKGNVGRIAENLIDRDFSTTKPFEKWTTDVTQFSFSWGKCYLSDQVLMKFSKRVRRNH